MRPINAYLSLILNIRIDVVALDISQINFTIFWSKSRSYFGHTGEFLFIQERGLTVPFRKRKIRAVAPSAYVEQRRLCQVFSTIFYSLFFTR